MFQMSEILYCSTCLYFTQDGRVCVCVCRWSSFGKRDVNKLIIHSKGIIHVKSGGAHLCTSEGLETVGARGNTSYYTMTKQLVLETII